MEEVEKSIKTEEAEQAVKMEGLEQGLEQAVRSEAD
jgi:hypothetical protein